MKKTTYVIVGLVLLAMSVVNAGALLLASLGLAASLSTNPAFPAAPQKPKSWVVRTHYGGGGGGGGGGYFGGK